MELEQFFQFIWKETNGYVRVAHKNPNSADYAHKFFQWPSQTSEIVEFVKEKTLTDEVYYSPAIFERPVGKKKAAKGSHVVWIEFDGNAPLTLSKELPPPSLVIQSSKPTHQHWYWELDNFSSPEEVEKINRQLTYYYQSDLSGYDIVQLLRPLETYNHKRQLDVLLKDKQEFVYHLSDLEIDGFELPAPLSDISLNDIPSILRVVGTRNLPEAFIDSLMSGFPEADRSGSLVRIGYEAAELGLNNEEIMSVLLHADETWGKYAKREDHVRRLLEIVIRVRMKHPNTKLDSIEFFSLSSLLEAQEQFDWAWEYFVSSTGYCLITGEPGIGKTQVTLNAAMHMALGKEFLGETIKRPLRVGYLSLEMGIQEIQYFIKQMVLNFTEEERQQLDSNLLVAPIGASLEVGNASIQSTLEQVVRDNHLDGIFFDTLGSMTQESLSSNDKDVKIIMNWTDKLRNSTNTFVMINHHMRKANGDNRKPNKLSDVYGSAYITARATSVFCLWSGPTESELDLITLKNRLAQKRPSLRVKRTGNLGFTTDFTPAGKEKNMGSNLEENKWLNF